MRIKPKHGEIHSLDDEEAARLTDEVKNSCNVGRFLGAVRYDQAEYITNRDGDITQVRLHTSSDD